MATQAQVYQLYLAYFGRPPDFTGLNSFANSTPAQVQAVFSASAESRALLASSDTATQVNNIYQNLFGRNAEPAGLAFWVNEIASGRVTLASAAFDILNGARNADATTVANRIEVAQAFVANYSATTAGILGYVGDNAAATARTFLRTVTDTAASKTAALAGVAAAVTSTVAAGSVVAAQVGSTFTLTTSVDAVSGGAGNDTINGIIGASGTYTVGDNINGGAGSDTLNLIDAGSATSAPLVSLTSVETVNVRMLTAGTTIINANDWNGVTTLSNASSFAGSTLQASGVATTTNIKVFGDSDINVAYSNTTTASSVSLSLVSVGTGNTATTIGSASGVATANIDLDLNNSGLLAAVAIDVTGTVNLARIEAGSNVTAYSVVGSGNAALVTDDTITTFDASGAAGNIDITFQGASDVAAKGGAGNDTFRFGTTISNNDSVDGGAGTNTVTATIGGFNRNLNTTNVQSTTLTFSDDAGGTVNGASSTIATYNVAAGSAGADGNVSNMAPSAVVNLASDNLDDVALGYSSASVGTVNIGSASGAVGIDLLDVSGVAALTINGVGGTAGAGTVARFSANSTLTSVTIQSSGGEADLTFTSASAAGVRSLTIIGNGSGAITLTSGFDAGSAMTTINVVASGDAADVTLGSLALANTALNSVTLTGNSAGDVTVGTLQFGNGLTADAAGTLTLNAANGSVVGTTAMDISASGSFSLTIAANASASGSIAVGDIVFNAGTASTAASANALTINAGTIGNNGSIRVEQINFEAGTAGQKLNIGAVVLGTSAGFEIGASGISAVDVANISIGAMNITVGNDASATVASGGIFTTGGAVGAITLTVADSGSARFGTIFASTVGAISISVSGDGETDLGGITGTDAIGNISLVAQNEGDIQIGAISGSGTIGAINIGVEVSASAVFSTIDGTSVGAITVSGAGYVAFGTISAASIGTVDARQMTSGTFTVDLSGVVRAAEVKLGAATNTVISGDGRDVITLTAGVTGNDNIRYSTANITGTDNIIGFFAGSTGLDQIEIGVSGLGLVDGAGLALTADAAVSFVTMSSGTATMASTNSVIILTSAAATTAAMIDQLSAGAAFASARATSDSDTILVVWTDGSDSYISTVVIGTTGASGTVLTFASAASITAGNTLAQISGVTPGAFVAANFDFV